MDAREQEFPAMPRLRDHILRKKCTQFDPSRTDTPTPLAMDLLRPLYDGNGMHIFLDNGVRTRLTLQCQQCEASFTGPPQLLYHLQSCHGPLWTQATDWCSYLCTIVQTKSLSCICNPGPAKILVTHQCAPHRQLAMMHIRNLNDLEVVPLAEAMLLPFSMTKEHVAEILPASLPTEVLEFACTCLQQRQFDALWKGPVAVYAKQHCLLCDVAMQDADLLHHLHEVHSLAHHGATPLIQTLHSHFLQSLGDSANTLSTCPLCDVCLTTPVQDHLSTCVVAFQTISLVHLTQDFKMSESLEDLNLEDTSVEMSDVFRHLTPLLGKSPQKTLAPQNGEEQGGKRKKASHKGQGKGRKGAQHQVPAEMPNMVQLMAKLVLRHDQQLRSMLIDNSFVGFLGQHPQGILHVVISDAEMEASLRGQESGPQPSQSPLVGGVSDSSPARATDCPSGSQRRVDPALLESQAPPSGPSLACTAIGPP